MSTGGEALKVIKFAAQSELFEKLTKEEHKLLNETVKVISRVCE